MENPLKDLIKEIVEEVVEEITNKKIKEHELRVGWISGIIGVLFVFGIVHAIWMLKTGTIL